MSTSAPADTRAEYKITTQEREKLFLLLYTLSHFLSIKGKFPTNQQNEEVAKEIQSQVLVLKRYLVENVKVVGDTTVYPLLEFLKNIKSSKQTLDSYIRVSGPLTDKEISEYGYTNVRVLENLRIFKAIDQILVNDIDIMNYMQLALEEVENPTEGYLARFAAQ